jgi:hypothetical protein
MHRAKTPSRQDHSGRLFIAPSVNKERRQPGIKKAGN